MRFNAKAAADEETLRRLRTTLARYKREGRAMISIDHVLDLMDSNGAWRFGVGVPDGPGAEHAGGTITAQPLADPITGAMPVDPAAYR